MRRSLECCWGMIGLGKFLVFFFVVLPWEGVFFFYVFSFLRREYIYIFIYLYIYIFIFIYLYIFIFIYIYLLIRQMVVFMMHNAESMGMIFVVFFW